jgi:hypothetical protein
VRKTCSTATVRNGDVLGFVAMVVLVVRYQAMGAEMIKVGEENMARLSDPEIMRKLR